MKHVSEMSETELAEALDAALKTANLPTDARIKLKMALSKEGLLASADRRISTQGRL